MPELTDAEYERLLAVMDKDAIRDVLARVSRGVDRLIEAMGPYWDEYDALLVDADARSATHVQFVDEPGRWVVTQFLADPDGDGEWRFTAVVDLERAMADGAPTLELSSLGSAAR